MKRCLASRDRRLFSAISLKNLRKSSFPSPVQHRPPVFFAISLQSFSIGSSLCFLVRADPPELEWRRPRTSIASPSGDDGASDRMQ